ncbi:hypothetical protein [Vampirovibrio chlorellavorus]|uniref:hypothetical protein n=1 Tax=Vampirovibrio chlorellavorus TaxID=758823 RepID=UPI0026F14FA9|nr:hypothetical protein [Vampirovibrio chlorellavorus]
MQPVVMNPQAPVYTSGRPTAWPNAGPNAALYGQGQPAMGMTQLPGMPRPPYLQNTAPMTASGIASGATPVMDDLPSPDQLLRGPVPMRTTTYVIPNVFGPGPAEPALPAPCQAAPSVCAPTRQAYQTASSFPVNSLDPSAPVPPPYLLAPWLYGLHPSAVQPAAPASMMPQPMQPQQPPAMPPQQPPPQTPPAAENKGPSTPLDESALSDHQIRSLNERLNSETEDTRADAAMELFKILDQDPSLSHREPYSRYVNAFMEKILKDPSAVVRSAGELALQTGRVQQPSEGVMSLLNELSNRPTGLSGESGIISSLLGSIRNQTLGQGFDKTPGAMTIDPVTRARSTPTQPPAAPTDGMAPQAPGPASAPMPQAPVQQAPGMGYGPPLTGNGQQLNYVSPSPSFMGPMGQNPALGQRLNLQEGYP